MATLGSLFDGSGGFPLAGTMCGITPVWSSEIEPFPLRVTAARFPDVKQLGSVLDINGAEIEPVDIITFGSPCQDLSVAGLQKGIHAGERSNLFFEAIRIIKEMRDAEKRIGRSGVNIRPRFAVWENVPGAFSSNKGADFQAVLQAFASVCEDGLPIPRPKKWNHAGAVVGHGWSVAWRVYDAQYWGVPQRRKRIYLIADFASERAGEILFEREGLRGDSAESGTAGEGTAADVEGGAGGSCVAFGWANSIRQTMRVTDSSPPIKASPNDYPATCYALKGNYIDRDTRQNGTGWRDGEMYTLDATDRHGVAYGIDCRNGVLDEEKTHTIQAKSNGGISQNSTPSVVYDARGNGDGNTTPTLTGDHQNRVTDYTALCIGNGQMNNISMKPIANTLDTMSDQQKVVYESDNPPRKYIVRRLTPTECCRLQGFPDWWTDGVEGSDSAKYKMWGNGIALPCAYDVLRRIAEEYDN